MGYRAAMALIHEALTRQIVATYFEIYNVVGCGFLESVYAGAFCTELSLRGIPHSRERRYPVHYKGTRSPAPQLPESVTFAGRIRVQLHAQTRNAPTRLDRAHRLTRRWPASRSHPNQSLNSFSSTPTHSLFCIRTSGCLSR